jgi:competence protein CoiA
MKFALVNGQRQEAQPDLVGACQTCGHPMVAKCGEARVWHWAHKGSRFCDPWWVNETPWHRTWKGQFPTDWQEIFQRAGDGERHIADVKTEHGWVLEFQYSHIKPEERRSRERFYPKLVWVVNGTRRTRDRQQFSNAWESGLSVGNNSAVRRAFSDECAILREWASGPAPVFLDFGEGEQALWWLLHTSRNGLIYVARFWRSAFIEIHRNGAFDGLAMELAKLVAGYELHLQARSLPGIPQFFTLRERSRRRF